MEGNYINDPSAGAQESYKSHSYRSLKTHGEAELMLCKHGGGNKSFQEASCVKPLIHLFEKPPLHLKPVIDLSEEPSACVPRF